MWTVKGLSHTHTCTHSPQIPSHPGCHIILKSFLCYTVDPCWLFILNIALSGFDINVIFNQWKDLGSISSFSVFWETLFKTDMFSFLETGCIFFYKSFRFSVFLVEGFQTTASVFLTIIGKFNFFLSQYEYNMFC